VEQAKEDVGVQPDENNPNYDANYSINDYR
jgi:hypothetical protein